MNDIILYHTMYVKLSDGRYIPMVSLATTMFRVQMLLNISKSVCNEK